MPRREWILKFNCSHPECKEFTVFRYDRAKDADSSFEKKRYSGGRWKCLRHKDPDRLLSADNRETRFEIASEQKEYGRFFGGFGVMTGPGFLAYANDFPPGTRLIVTARIELPEEQPCNASNG